MAVLGETGLSAAQEIMLRTRFWMWFLENKGMVIVEGKVFGVIPWRVTVGQLRPLFVILFGEPLRDSG